MVVWLSFYWCSESPLAFTKCWTFCKCHGLCCTWYCRLWHICICKGILCLGCSNCTWRFWQNLQESSNIFLRGATQMRSSLSTPVPYSAESILDLLIKIVHRSCMSSLIWCYLGMLKECFWGWQNVFSWPPFLSEQLPSAIVNSTVVRENNKFFK